jgi:hypothetical protein
MPKRKLSTYNDGVVRLYRERPRKTDFNAKKNVATLEDMDLIVRLDYEESSRREEDVEFAERSGFSLTLKVRTRAVPGVDNTCKAVIDGYLYDVQYIDKSRTEMWLYLEGVKKLAT